MRLQDTQYTADELALMRGEPMPGETAVDDEAPSASTANDLTDADLDAEAADGDAPASDDAAEPAAAEVAPEAEPQAEAPPFQFDGSLPADYATQKQALRDEKTALRTQWSNGDLSDEDFAAKEAEWEDKYEALQASYLTAQALATANAQIVAQENTKVLRNIATAAAKQGIDYADDAVAMVYDQKLAQVKADPAFKDKPFAQVAAEAHTRVAKLFGKVTTPATETKADGTKTNERVRIPTTLANMPAAAATNLADSVAEDDLGDDPDIAEARWAQMPTSKRSAVLRSTLPANRR
jgi:hypothetical protein